MTTGERSRALASAVLGGSILLSIGAAVAAGPAVAETTLVGEHIRSFEAAITIEKTGDLRISEEFVYDFGATSRHGFERLLVTEEDYDTDYVRRYDIDVLDVSGSPGTPAQYEVRHELDQLVLRIGDPERTIRGEHTYRIDYRVHDALNGFDDHDELYWDILGNRMRVPIADATLTVTAPGPVTEPACFRSGYSRTQGCLASSAGSTATFTAADVRVGEEVTLGVSFAKGLVSAPKPNLDTIRYSGAWWRDWAEPDVTTGLLGLAALGAAGASVMARRRRATAGAPAPSAEQTPGGDLIPVEFVPPEGVTPGQLGTLIDGKADTRDIAAVLLDLARRGYLRIEGTDKSDWTLVKGREPGGELIEHERLLLVGLFSKETTRVVLSTMKNQFHAVVTNMQAALYRDGIAQGWFSQSPVKARAKHRRVAILVGVLAAVLFLATISYGKHMLATLPVAALAGYLLVAAQRQAFRTATGDAVAARAQGFRRFIEEADVERARLAERENVLLEYLPYAVAFGATDRWTNALAELNVPPPEWLGDGLGPDVFDRRLGDFLEDVRRNARPEPQRTSFSGGDSYTRASSGSRSYSSSSSRGGGGRAGGGGGGGGGGSW